MPKNIEPPLQKLSASDFRFMERALKLASRGKGKTAPNPMVGAVLVKNGRILAEGHHKGPGGLHAEAIVLEKSGARAKGSVLYVNLEPCCHKDKRTPPCAQAILHSGVRRVVVGDTDPNPKVRGRGLRLLRKAGIEVSIGVLSEKERRLNEIYRKVCRTELPFVILKSAMSLDGRLTPPGRSTGWVTGGPARMDGHRIRAGVDAILVGVNTVIKDNPRLTNRSGLNKKTHPLRVILDSRLRTPPASRALKKGEPGGSLIIGTPKAPASRVRSLERAGATVWLLKEKAGRVDFPAVIRRLGKTGIRSVLVEGGGHIHRSALESGMVDKLIWYIAPSIVGFSLGSAKKVDFASSLGLPQIRIREASRLKQVSFKKIGRDIRIEAYTE